MTFEVVAKEETRLQHQLSDKESAAVLKWLTACSEFNESTQLKVKLLASLSSCEI